MKKYILPTTLLWVLPFFTHANTGATLENLRTCIEGHKGVEQEQTLSFVTHNRSGFFRISESQVHRITFISTSGDRAVRVGPNETLGFPDRTNAPRIREERATPQDAISDSSSDILQLSQIRQRRLSNVERENIEKWMTLATNQNRVQTRGLRFDEDRSPLDTGFTHKFQHEYSAGHRALADGFVNGDRYRQMMNEIAKRITQLEFCRNLENQSFSVAAHNERQRLHTIRSIIQSFVQGKIITGGSLIISERPTTHTTR